MRPEDVIEVLNERIKELSCLYEISNLVALNQYSYNDTMAAIVRIIPKAWKYTDDAIAEITVSGQKFITREAYKKAVSQSANIKINGIEKGKIKIHYPANKYDTTFFLSEEQMLLNKLAVEIGTYVERFERKKQEELLQRKLQHNDRLAILGQITAGIAHELNTPLASILGFSELLKEEKDMSKHQELDKIISSAVYAREIVKKLMFFSFEMPQQMQPVSITELVQEAVNLLQPSLQKSEINLDLNIPSKDIIVELDPIQLTQVIFNLIINSIHATPAGGQINIKVEEVDDDLLMTFTDTGKGIPQDVKERIFEPFFTTKPMGEGTGLGLSVVHGIIQTHNGNIDVFSEAEKGTTFKITIPKKQK